MIVRRADHFDIPKVIRLARNLHDKCKFPGDFIYNDFEYYVDRLLQGGVILISESGVIAGEINSVPWNVNYRVAFEHFWFAEDGNGFYLLESFENFYSYADEVRISFQDSNRPETMLKALRRKGYSAVEAGMVKKNGDRISSSRNHGEASCEQAV